MAQNTNDMHKSIRKYTETVKGSADLFVGEVEVGMILNPTKEPYYMSAGNVKFHTKARTNWHTHDNGQVLVVTNGIGYYQEEGKEIAVIREGDVVKIPAFVKHWHGASHEASMTHIAIISEADKKTVVDWMEPVTDEQFDEILKSRK
ncbi:MAG: cupin domain-containing protein [Mangrovibacterium sp.]